MARFVYNFVIYILTNFEVLRVVANCYRICLASIRDRGRCIFRYPPALIRGKQADLGADRSFGEAAGTCVTQNEAAKLGHPLNGREPKSVCKWTNGKCKHIKHPAIFWWFHGDPHPNGGSKGNLRRKRCDRSNWIQPNWFVTTNAFAKSF